MDQLGIAEEPAAIQIAWAGRPLFRYVYDPQPPLLECPKPFIHPLRTVTGDVLTTFRPRDHRWHTGLFLGFSKIADQDFWGGPTWVPGQGWVQLNNVGSIRHAGWEALEASGGSARLVQALAWHTAAGERWLTERRVLEARSVSLARGTWELHTEFTLTNVSPRDLPLGHPASSGLAGYAYGGLTWRGPRAFETDSRYFTSERSGSAVHGSRAPWLAFCGEHDEHDRWSTVIFVDDPGNPRHPTGWGVWTGEFVQVSCVFHVDSEYVIERGTQLRLGYRLIIADGAWTEDDVESYLAAAPSADG